MILIGLFKLILKTAKKSGNWKEKKLHASILFATNEKDKDLNGIIIDDLKSILCNYTLS